MGSSGGKTHHDCCQCGWCLLAAWWQELLRLKLLPADQTTAHHSCSRSCTRNPKTATTETKNTGKDGAHDLRAQGSLRVVICRSQAQLPCSDSRCQSFVRKSKVPDLGFGFKSSAELTRTQPSPQLWLAKRVSGGPKM